MRRMGYVAKPSKRHKTYRVFFTFRGTPCSVSGFPQKNNSIALLRSIESLVGTIEAGGNLSEDTLDWINNRMSPEVRDRLVGFGVLSRAHLTIGKPLSKLLEKWERHIKDTGRTAKHAKETRKRAERLAELCGFEYYSDIKSEKVIAKHGVICKTNSASTARHYVKSLKAFCVYMKDYENMTRNPLDGVKISQVRDEQLKKVRAVLSLEEQERLIKAAQSSEAIRYGMSGNERSLMYRLALKTGLRAASIDGLTVGSLNLTRKPYGVTATVKGGKSLTVPLVDRSLIHDLKAHSAHKMPTVKLFDTPSIFRFSRMLNQDLAEAKIEAPHGKILDFHALRTSFATTMAESGVPIQILKELLGHVDVRVTMKYYIKTEQERLAQELEAAARSVKRSEKRKVE